MGFLEADKRLAILLEGGLSVTPNVRSEGHHPQPCLPEVAPFTSLDILNFHIRAAHGVRILSRRARDEKAAWRGKHDT